MKMLSFFIFAAATQGSLAMVTKARSNTLPISQDDSQEEVVRVAEPDIVTDESESKVTPSKALAQTNAKIVNSAAADQEDVVRVAEPDIVTDESESKVTPSKALAQTTAKVINNGAQDASAKVIDNGAQDASEFTDAKIGTGLVSPSEAGSETEAGNATKYATPDVVQDSSASAKADTDTIDKMDANITFRDDDVVTEVDADVVTKKQNGDQTIQNAGGDDVVRKVDADVVVKKDDRQTVKNVIQNVTQHVVETKTNASESHMVAPEEIKAVAQMISHQQADAPNAVTQVVPQKQAEAPKVDAQVVPQKQAEAPKAVAQVVPQKQPEAPKVVAQVVPQKQAEAPKVEAEVVEDGDEDFVAAPIRNKNAAPKAEDESPTKVEPVIEQRDPVLEDDDNDEGVVVTPKRTAAVQVSAAKVHVAAAAPSEAPAQLKALAVSKNLRGVEPKEIQPGQVHEADAEATEETEAPEVNVQAKRRQEHCDQGSEFNTNDC